MPELYLPARLAREVNAERQAKAMAMQRADPIVITQPGIATRSLGTQPSKAALLRENKGWAAIAARPIAERIMDLPWQAVERMRAADGEVVVEERPQSVLQELLDNPGPVFTKQLLLWTVAYHLVMTGEAWVQKVTNQLDATRELWPLPTDRTHAIYDAMGNLAGAEIQSDQGVTRLPAAELIRIWTPDPLTMVSPIGNLGPQALEWNTQRALVGVEEAHFSNGATPPVVIKGEPGAADPKQFLGGTDDAEFDQTWAEYWGDRFNLREGQFRGIPAFLPPGFDVTELQQHRNIADLTTIDTHLAEQFLAAFGVPGSIVGQVVDVNRAAAETNRFVFDQNTVSPKTSLISSAFTLSLAKDFGENWAVQFDPFVAADKDFELKREAQDLTLFVRSVDQVREDRGKDPVEWGAEPVASIGSVPYRPDDAFDANLGFDEPGQPPRSETQKRTAEHDRADAAMNRQLAAERRSQRRYARTVRGLFETQRRETLRRYRDATRTDDETLFREVHERVEVVDIFNPVQWLPLWLRRLLPQRQDVFEGEANATTADLSGGDFNFTETAAEFLTSEARRDALNVQGTTAERIAAVLSRGVAEGQSTATVARSLSAIFRDRPRANMIARTEVGSAFTSGQLAGANSSGVVQTKTWNTSEDEAVRDTHQAINGDTVALTETFNVGGALGQGPRTPDLPIGERANCRCFLTFGTADDTDIEV